MSADNCLAHITHPDWLAHDPLTHLVTPFIKALRVQRYAERTIIALADAIPDRLIHNAYRLTIDGDSMRKKQRLTPSAQSA